VKFDYGRQDSGPERAFLVSFLRNSFRQTFFGVLIIRHCVIRSDLKKIFMQVDIDHRHNELLRIINVRGQSPNFLSVLLRREREFLAIAE
jgi:hypothetical protein